MDAFPALFILSITSTVLAVLGLASAAWGTDSRPRIGDDHAR
jgi:hypothetical protein